MHPNEELLRKGYDAFGKMDMDTLRDLLSPDIVWHFPGKSQLAGDYRRIDQVLELFAKSFELSGGTLNIEIHDVLANDQHGIALVVVRGQRNGKSLESRQAHLFHVKDGKATEFWGHPEDQYAVDEFWS